MIKRNLSFAGSLLASPSAPTTSGSSNEDTQISQHAPLTASSILHLLLGVYPRFQCLVLFFSSLESSCSFYVVGVLCLYCLVHILFLDFYNKKISFSFLFQVQKVQISSDLTAAGLQLFIFILKVNFIIAQMHTIVQTK